MANEPIEQMQRLWAELAGPALPADAKERKQRRILETATELFVEQGYRKTSVDEIARAAHVAKGTVYLYFPSKAHLLLGAVALEERSYASLMEPLFDPARPARERLLELLRVMLVVSEDMPLISRVMSGDQELAIALGEAEQLAPDLMTKMDEFRRYLIEPLLQECHGGDWTPEELDERSRVFFGLMFVSGLLQRPEIRQGLKLERFAGLLAEMLVDGIAAPAATRSTS